MAKNVHLCLSRSQHLHILSSTVQCEKKARLPNTLVHQLCPNSYIAMQSIDAQYVLTLLPFVSLLHSQNNNVECINSIQVVFILKQSVYKFNNDFIILILFGQRMLIVQRISLRSREL